MRKTFKKLHLWLSLPFGLIISVLCFSGAALVFEKEISEAAQQPLYFVKEAGSSTLSMDELAERVTATLPDSITVTGLTAFADPQRTWQATLSQPRRASVYINPYTGEITGRYERAPFFAFMFRLHRWLLDTIKPDGGMFWGKMIVGVSTLAFVFVLLSGLFVWIPRNRKALRNRLRVERQKGRRRLWYDLHVSVGIYIFLFLLMMSLTGLTWSFDWYRTGLYKIFGVEAPTGGGHGGSLGKGEGGGERRKEGGDASRLPFAHWQNVYNQLAAANSAYHQITVGQGVASVTFDRWGNRRAADQYKYDSHTGEFTGVVLYRDAAKANKIFGWIYSLHVGSFGGTITRIIWFFAALVGASLPLTGYYLWMKRKRWV
ncbi:MAG: PepSY domain-containing protein [Mediterranea sp.]|jgi:uncharacterized iron-regulated membrane protein|nr:PepSY domain-containing protein [Mediterranea sp.]